MHYYIIFAAQYVLIVPVILAAIVFWQLKDRRTKWRFILTIVLAGIVALVLARLASMLWYDPRPFVVGHFRPLLAHAADNGFPSDHTLLAALIGWAVLAYSRKYGIVILGLALLIGTARVLAGVHHPLDIVGSFVVSAAAVLIVMSIEKLIIAVRGNRS